MNKIYKVIWSKVKNQYVVVSELAHSNGKQSRTARKSLRSRIAALVVCGAIAALGVYGALPTQQAFAAEGDETVSTAPLPGALANIEDYVAYKAESNAAPNNPPDGYYLYTDPDNASIKYWVRDGFTIDLGQIKTQDGTGTSYGITNVYAPGDKGVFNEVLTNSTVVEEGMQAHRNDGTEIEGQKVQTNIGQALNQVNLGNLVGSTNAVGPDAAKVPMDYSYYIQNSKGQWVNVGLKHNPTDFYNNFKTVGNGLDYDEHTGKYYYTNPNDEKKVVDFDNIYYIDVGEEKPVAGVFVNDQGYLYEGTVWGATGEILTTAQDGDGLKTYWSAVANADDIYLKDSNLTVGELNKAFDTLETNDERLYNNDIKEITVKPGQNGGGTLGLLRNGTDENGELVEGAITVEGVGGTGGDDTGIKFSQKDETGEDIQDSVFTINTGSRVEGKGSDSSETSVSQGSLTGLTINGQYYTVPEVIVSEDDDTVNIKEGNTTNIDLITTSGEKHIATSGDTDNENKPYTGVYTADADGTVKLTEVDGTGKPTGNTLQIKDVASKTALDKLDDLAVKYDDKNKDEITLGGLGEDGEPSKDPVAIHNVADGVGLNDAVNVSQLKDVEALAGKHTIITVNGGTAAPTIAEGETESTYTGGNLQLKQKNNDGRTEYDVKLNDDIYLGGDQTADSNNIALNGSTGTISATVENGMSSDTLTFDGDGLTVSKDTLGYSDGSTNISGDTITTTDEYNNSTTIDGGSVTTENLTVNAENDNTLTFNSNGLNVNSSDTNFNVGEDGISLSVDNGEGNNSSLKVTQDGTEFSYSKNGVSDATTTTIKGNTVTISSDARDDGKDIVIDGNTGTITGLSNTDLNDPTFATMGRAATEEQLQKASVAATTTVTEGKNIDVTSTVDKEDGHTNYEVKLQDNVVLGDNKITLNGNPGEGEDLLNVDNALIVGQDGTTTIAADNAETIGVDTRVTVNTDGVTFEGLENGSTIIDGQTIQAGGVFINDGGNGQITRLTNTTLDDPTFATVGRAATEEQLQLATDAATTTVSEGKNIDVTSTVDEEDGHTDYEVSLQDNVSLGDGKITLNGAPAEGDDLLNVDNAFVVGQDGTTTITADDAGTMGADTKVTVGTDGVKFEGLENGTTTIDGQTIQAGGVFINDGGNGQITRLTNTTLDDPTFATVGRAATEEQLQLAKDAATTTVSEGKNIDVTSTVAEDGHTDYKVSLQDEVKLGDYDNGTGIYLGGASGTISATGSISVGEDQGLIIDGQKKEIQGLSNTTWNEKIANDAAVEGSTAASTAATQGQLQEVSKVANAGWTASDGTNSISVKPNETLNFVGDENLTVSADGTDKELKVALKDDITLKGDSSSIELTGTKGTIQVNQETAEGTNFTNINGNVVSIGYTNSEGIENAIVIDGGKGTITGLSNTTWDDELAKQVANSEELQGTAATQGQLQQAVSAVATEAAKQHTTVSGDDNLTVKSSVNENGGTNYQVTLDDDITLGNPKAGNTEGERSFTINTTDPEGYVPKSYETGSGADFIKENGGFMLFATDTQGYGVFGVTAKGSAWAKDFKTYTTDIYGNNTQYSLNEIGDAVAQMSSYYNKENGKSYTVFSRYLNEAEKDNPFATVDENATRDIPLALRDDGTVLIGATIKGDDFIDNGIRINAEIDDDGNNVATITGLENTTWTPPAPVATFANEGTETSRAATEAQLNDLYSTVVGYNVDTNGVNYGTVTLGGGRTSYDQDTHEGGTVLNNVAYASGTDGSEAVNVDYLKDTINKAVEAGGSISNSDKHLVANTAEGSNGVYKPNAEGNVNLIVSDEKGNSSTITIGDVASKTELDSLKTNVGDLNYDKVTGDKLVNGDSVTTAIGKLDNKIENISGTATDAANNTVTGGTIKDDGTISLTQKDGGTVALDGKLTDSGVVQDGTKFDGETGTITITSQDKYSGKTSSVKVEGIASTEVVGATNKEDLATAYKDADKDGNATTEYITDSESMVEADVALDHAIQDVANTGYANDMVLSNRIDSVEKRLGNVEERIDKVGAMAAAIANLRTMGFDPEAPTEIAIGVGQYKSETGIAIGVFHYPNQDFMLSASLSSSGDELMGGIGATWKLGRKSAAERAKDEEARHLEQAEEMKKLAQQEKVKAQAQRHAKLLAERQQASQKNA